MPITTQDKVFDNTKLHAFIFHFSVYQEYRLYCEDNKKVIEKFTDELNDEIALERIGFKSKMYSIKFSKGKKPRAKVGSTQIVREKIRN